MKARTLFSVLAACAVVLACSSFARAQATRTWVSGVGDDVNPCSRTAPCKTFAGAISKTAAGGEISTLDPGGFGAVTITKAITIDGAGTLGSILFSLTNGVVVNAGATDVVTLRNIALNGAGTGINGIRFLGGDHLHVENCSISGTTMNGIDVSHSGVGAGRLTVADTSFTDIGGAAIRLAATAGSPSAQIEDVRVNGASVGLDVVNGYAAIADSRLTHVANQAVVAEGAGTRINVEHSALESSGVGVAALGAGALVLLSDSDVTLNATGVHVQTGAKVISFQNNRIQGNTVNVAGKLAKGKQR